MAHKAGEVAHKDGEASAPCRKPLLKCRGRRRLRYLEGWAGECIVATSPTALEKDLRSGPESVICVDVPPRVRFDQHRRIKHGHLPIEIEFDVSVGVNLLQEGLDMPEVSLVAILDDDKEGFLRNARSLTQTAGRAARNAIGLVIFYADKITASMRTTIDETNRRRAVQTAYNEKHGITPMTITKTKEEIINQKSILDIRGKKSRAYVEPEEPSLAADPIINYMSKDQLDRLMAETEE